MMRSFKTEGIIIKRRDSNEADRILTVYTKSHGKISVKAKGVKRVTSRRSSHIELLNHTQISLYKASQIPVLVEAQMINSFAEIKNDLQKTGFAYHICELIDGLCPEGQEQQEIFTLLKNTLNQLSLVTHEELVYTIHAFEIQLLTQLGFWHDTVQASKDLDTEKFIESILERKLKSNRIFSKLQ